MYKHLVTINRCGYPTLPIFGQKKDGCTLHRWWTCIHDGSSAGKRGAAWQKSLWSRHWRGPPLHKSHSLSSFITRTVAASMHQKTTSFFFESTGSSWAEKETAMTMHASSLFTASSRKSWFFTIGTERGKRPPAVFLNTLSASTTSSVSIRPTSTWRRLRMKSCSIQAAAKKIQPSARREGSLPLRQAEATKRSAVEKENLNLLCPFYWHSTIIWVALEIGSLLFRC